MSRHEWIVLKLGGELLEDPERMQGIARAIAATSRTARLVVIHGGGREIDAALARAGLSKRQVDGLRITDEATLGVVVEVLAGVVNTRFVRRFSSPNLFKHTLIAMRVSHVANSLSPRNESSFCHNRMKTSCVRSLASVSSSAMRRAKA